MSVIIRLQNLPWSANALDIRNYFRGLSIPEGGVHIVGGELGDAFIAFSTDEDARQAMMLDGGKIKEIQVKLHLSSRSEMHKVIEAARQSVPLLSLAAAPPVVTPAPAPPPPVIPAPPPPPVIPAVITPFSAALGNNSLSSFGIPGLGNPQEIPQPAVIELPPAHVSPNDNSNLDEDRDEERLDNKRREKDRRRSRSRSRDRDRKDRKRDRRDRSRSRERRRRDRSRSRENRRDRKRDRKERSRSRDRSPSRRSRDRRKSPSHSQEKEVQIRDAPQNNPINPFANPGNLPPQLQQMLQTNVIHNVPLPHDSPRSNDLLATDTMNKMQELAKKRNPNAFQGDLNGGKQQQGPNSRGGMGRGGMGRGQGFQRERRSRFASDEQPRDCCVAIRNAPNHTSYGDVRRFFPFMIDKHGIKMINDNMGRRTGNIYVRFIECRSKQLSLQRKNNELKGAQVIVEDLDDDAYDAAVDSYLPYREDNDGEDANLLIADIQERSKPAFSVLKLSDMPHYVKEHDIFKTFNNFSLLSITLKDCRLTRSKIAFVKFAKEDEARMALEQKERFAFGRRQPSMVPVTDEEFATEKTADDWPNDDVISIPSEDPPQEVAAPRDPRQRRQQLDSARDSAPTQGKPPLQAQGPQGAPFFVQPFAQNPAFPPVQNPGFPAGGQFPGPQFGGFPGTGSMDPRTAASNWANRPPFPNQMEQIPGPIQKQIKPTPPTNLEDDPLDCVLMKGLPRDTTDRAIVDYLSEAGAMPARIHLMMDQNGMPSGDCFCEFRSTREARLATGKHGSNFEGCRITVDIVPRSVVEEALDEPKQIKNQMLQESVMNNGPPQYFESMPRGNFNNRGSFRGRGGFDRGGFDRGGFNRGGFDSGRSFRGRGSRGGFEGRGRGRGGHRGGGPSNFDNNGMRNVPDDNDAALEDFGAPGCVVSMENVPFRATIDEILHFFSEFELTQDDIIRRYNERGQPTGDARVAFRTPFDAQRAVKTRHMDNIHERRINLNIL